MCRTGTRTICVLKLTLYVMMNIERYLSDLPFVEFVKRVSCSRFPLTSFLMHTYVICVCRVYIIVSRPSDPIKLCVCVYVTFNGNQICSSSKRGGWLMARGGEWKSLNRGEIGSALTAAVTGGACTCARCDYTNACDKIILACVRVTRWPASRRNSVDLGCRG